MPLFSEMDVLFGWIAVFSSRKGVPDIMDNIRSKLDI